MGRVDLAAERAGEPDLVDRIDLELVHEQADAGIQGRLAELDRPHVVLGDEDPRLAVGPVGQDVAEGPPVGDDARRACRERPIDDAVLGDDAGEVQLGDDLDDARATDAGDARDSAAATASAKSGASDHGSTPMTRNRGSRVVRSMRTRSMAPGAARWPPLIWAPSKAGPVGLDAASSRRLSPRTISAFVPTSTTRVIRSASCGSSARMTPAVSAPTWPAMHGRT